MIRSSSSSNRGVLLLSSLRKSIYEGRHGTVNLNNQQVARNTSTFRGLHLAPGGSADYDEIDIELCFKFKSYKIKDDDIKVGFKNGKTFCSNEPRGHSIRFRGMNIPIREARAECLRLKKEAFKAFNDWCIQNAKTEEDMNIIREAELQKFKASKEYQEIMKMYESAVKKLGKTFSSEEEKKG